MAQKGKPSIKEMLKSRIGRYLALFLVSAWMFVLGVLVGRGTAPVHFELGNLDAELAGLKAQEQRQQMARVKIGPQVADPKTDLEFYEELKKSQKHPELKARQPVEKPKPALKKIPNKEDRKASEKPAAKKSVQPSVTASSQKKNESSTKKADEKAPAAGTDSHTGALTVQAASLKDPQDAEDLVSRLKKKGYPAYKTIAVVPQQGIWFRVRVGQFESREDADSTLKRLKKDGFDPFLVKRNN